MKETRGSKDAPPANAGASGRLSENAHSNTQIRHATHARLGEILVKRGSLYVGRTDASTGVTRSCIFVPKPGVYALALYHDENRDGKFDRTGVGLPAEGYGFSNNPATLAGLPTFKSVRLAVPKSGLTTRVTMKYP